MAIVDFQKFFDKEVYTQAQRDEYLNKAGSISTRLAEKGAMVYPEEGVRYVDLMNGVDERSELMKGFSEQIGMDLSKAQTISGLASGTTDLTLIPIYVDPKIVDVTRRNTPLTELVSRVTNFGRTAEINRLTARGVAGWKPENAALPEADDTVARVTKSIRFAYSVGFVSGPFMAASKQYLSQNYVDGLNYEIRNKTETLKYVEEDSLINGNASGRSSAYGGITYVANLEPDGIINTISTNKTNQSSAAPSISNIRTLIRNAKTAGGSTTLGQGEPNLLLTDFATKDNVKSLLQAYLRYTNENYELPWGIKTLEFDGLPMLASKFMPTTSGSREIEVLSLNTGQARVLQDVTYQEIPSLNDGIKFMVKEYLTWICGAEEFNARGYNYA